MTINIIIDQERANYIINQKSAYYEAELFDVKDKINPYQIGVKITFPDWINHDSIALLMFHIGISFGIDKGIEVLNYKPNQFKDISVDGRNEN